MNNAVPKTSPGAIWSLVLGILGLICFGPFAAIPAVICGHVALGNIKRSMGALAGHGQALAGLIMGYIGIALAIILIPIYAAIMIPAFAQARAHAQQAVCINQLRTIEMAKAEEALKTNLEDGQPVEVSSLLPYFKDHKMPVCPRGGTYDIGAVGEMPRCTVKGHEIQPK